MIKSIETPNINDRDGVPFQIFYGISGNDHNFWSIANARKVIGTLQVALSTQLPNQILNTLLGRVRTGGQL